MVRRRVTFQIISGLPAPGARAVQILGDNPRRVGLHIKATLGSTVNLYDRPEIVVTGTGYVLNGGLNDIGHEIFWPRDTVPHSAIFAGSNVGLTVMIAEVTEEDIG